MLKDVSSVTYTSNVIGKLFNFGDITAVAYTMDGGINIRGVKNAKMFVDNIMVLITNKDK